MSKKKYKKEKFNFLWNNGSVKLPKENDIYFKEEWRLKLKFPFLFHQITLYKLKGDYWIEQNN